MDHRKGVFSDRSACGPAKMEFGTDGSSEWTMKMMDTCEWKDSCGGCLYQGIAYEEQVRRKEQYVRDLMKEKKIRTGELESFEPAPEIYRYRNKMEYTFGDLVRDGELTLGLHKRKQFMSVITVDRCQLVDEDFNRILRGTLDFCVEKGYSKYHKKKHTGLLRNLVIRKGERTGEILVNLVTTSEPGFDEEGFKGMLLNLNLDHEIVGILRTVNDEIADVVTPGRVEVLFGRDYYNEKIMGLDFQVSAFSFFQTNISAVERLYTDALSMIDRVEGKTVFDLYCGTGTITQALAGRAGRVVGVEIVEDAVQSARINAEKNQLRNCTFLAGDVLQVLDTIPEKPDVLVLDPPRAGIHYRVLPKLLRYEVDQILYISCNPKTLMDNLKFMEENGYRIERMKAYDNFPFTKHVECVVFMSRVKD